MNKALLLQLWIFFLGFLFCNLNKHVFAPVFVALSALPVGWALFGICAAVVYGVHFSPVSQMILIVLLALATVGFIVINIKQRTLSKDSLLLVGASLVVLTAAGMLVDWLRIVTMVSDSSYLARSGQNIGLGNYESSRVIFSMWGPFVPFIHSLTNVLDQKLFWQYQPILSFDLLAIVFYTLYTTIREQRSALESWTGATALVSVMAVSNLFVFHFFYIHVMLIGAIYMYLLVYALLQIEKQPVIGYELLALLSLIAFGLVRIEAPLYGTLILLVACFRPRWSYANRLRLIVPFAVFFAAWYGRVYFILPSNPDLLSRGLALAVVAVLVGFGLFAVISGSMRFQPIVKRTPWLVVIGLILVSIVTTVSKPEHMLGSFVSIVRNILVYGNWGLTWYVIFFVAAGLYFTRRNAGEPDWLLMMLVSYILLVYNLAYFSIPYHIGDYDSANRLILQATPLVLLYLGRRFARPAVERC